MTGSVLRSVACMQAARKAKSPIGTLTRCCRASLSSSSPSSTTPTPSSHVKDELAVVTQRIHDFLEARSPSAIASPSSSAVMQRVSSYYFQQKGKLFRPTVILLMAKACSYLSRPSKPVILDDQITIATVAEMIHTASLVHDDVIDEASTRRNRPSVNAIYGIEPSILSGDFILAMASAQIAKLQNTAVITMLSRVIDELVRGELLQLKAEQTHDDRFQMYLVKTFMKTASLVARSCQAVASLDQQPQEVQKAAFLFGAYAGIAFQLIDDVLDVTGTSEQLGKPAATDMKLGLATAPVLFASQQYHELEQLIVRRFSHANDAESALQLVLKSDGVAKTEKLAEEYSQKAINALQILPDSAERRALIRVAQSVLTRRA